MKGEEGQFVPLVELGVVFVRPLLSSTCPSPLLHQHVPIMNLCAFPYLELLLSVDL